MTASEGAQSKQLPPDFPKKPEGCCVRLHWEGISHTRAVSCKKR